MFTDPDEFLENLKHIPPSHFQNEIVRKKHRSSLHRFYDPIFALAQSLELGILQNDYEGLRYMFKLESGHLHFTENSLYKIIIFTLNLVTLNSFLTRNKIYKENT